MHVPDDEDEERHDVCGVTLIELRNANMTDGGKPNEAPNLLLRRCVRLIDQRLAW